YLTLSLSTALRAWLDTPHPPFKPQEGLASVRSVIRPVVAIRPIVGIRRIDRRGVIRGMRIVAIDGRIVRIGYWIRIAPVITPSPANLLHSGLYLSVSGGYS